MIDEKIQNAIDEAIAGIEKVGESIKKNLQCPLVDNNILSECKKRESKIVNNKTKTFKSSSVPLLKIGFGAAVGATLLVIGLSTKKTGLTIGGAIALGADILWGIYMYNNSNNVDNTKLSFSNTNTLDYDFNKLVDKAFRAMQKLVGTNASLWNNEVEGQHSKLNNVIMISSIPEIEKSHLLAKTSKEVPYNPSLTKWLTQLEKLGKAKDLDGIETLLKEIQDRLRENFDNAMREQLDVYKTI